VKKITLVLLMAPCASMAFAQAPHQIVAQAIVDATLNAHSELNALTFHVTPPGAPDNIIVASNIAPIGKKADADDLSVIRTGKPIEEPNKAGTRYGIELPLLTVGGDVIGVVAIGYKFKTGENTSGFLAKAQALRDEIATRVPDAASLMKPAP
jgi:hypothetical protein